LYFSRYQLPLLESFISNPQSHAQAAADPILSGGPFIAIPPSRLAEVVQLRDRSVHLYEANKKLSDELIAFSTRLERECGGLSLSPWYEQLPETLRPYVELVYDYQHRPSLRFIEPLLYRSPLYRKDAQSIRLFGMKRDAERPYFLNTPRLPSDDDSDIMATVPFDSDASKALFAMDALPIPFGELRERLSLGDRQAATLESLVEPVREHEEMALNVYTYLGHATVLVRWKGTTILLDPVVAAKPALGGEGRYSFGDLPERIDFVAITHIHHDHFALETLARLASRIGTLLVPRAQGFLYGDVSLKYIAHHCNIANVVEMDALDVVPFNDGEIIAIPFLGEHSDLAHSKNAYAVRTGTQQAIFAADSDCLNEAMYEKIRDSIGKVHTLFIGTEHIGGPLSWNCGPLLPGRPTREQEKTRRSHGCDADRALTMSKILGVQRVCSYAMGLEPWLRCLLGAAVSPESPQMREAHKLIATAEERGYDARLLHGLCGFD
jgi:glyoxylase-like metal-dependent hydrolase (beta-lactamase superfamily II)